MAQSVLGISIGSQNTVISTFKSGIVNVILSDSSNRQIPTVTSYNDRERNIAELALQTNKSNFKRTIISPNRWLGIQKNWQNYISEESKFSNIPPIISPNGKIGFQINYKGKNEFYSPESLLGLFLNKLQNNWLREKIITDDIVISIPDYYTVYERKAMIESIEISNIQCTSLINESSAISLAYGLFRLKEFDDEKERIVGFVDMGHSKTTIFFGSFTKKKMKVISVTSERFCGGRDFDYLLAKQISEDFKKKFNCDPMSSPKVRIRLIDTISKIRKTLTVNKDAHINIDNLMDGEDLTYTLTKEDFEKIINPTAEKFRNLCLKSLKHLTEEAKINLDKVHSIEMVGCAVRTPIIQNIIKEVFGKEISKTLLPDECLSRGCTLFAAMNSPFFSVKNFEFEHHNPYTIIMEYPFLTKKGESVIRTHKIIKQGENIPGEKSIKFTNTQVPNIDIVPLKFYYDENEVDWMDNKLLNVYNVKLPKKKEEKWELRLKFLLDLNCIPSLTNAEIKETYTEEVEVKKEKKEEKKEEEKKEEKKEEEKKEEEKKEEKKEEEKKEYKTVVKDKYQDLKVERIDCLFGTPQGIINQLKEKENTQLKEDLEFKKVLEKKNELEQYIYKTREKMESAFKEYITPNEQNELPNLMNTLYNWLYSEDEEIFNLKKLEEKSKDMLNIGNKLYSRFNNWIHLKENLEILNNSITKIKNAVKNQLDLIEKQQPCILSKEDFDKLKVLIENAEKKLLDSKNKYEEGIKTEEPNINYNDIADYKKNLVDNVKKVYNDADFRVKEEKRKKEEEEKKKKEEEEKKKKEEEEKKKKEEEEKKNKNENKDIEMKDQTKEEEKKEEQNDKMDVE